MPVYNLVLTPDTELQEELFYSSELSITPRVVAGGTVW